MTTVAGDPPRCLVYVFDSLRYDRVAGGTTPNVDRVATDGVSFENAYSQGIWTYPSAASIFSGTYPNVHDSQQFADTLASSLPHLADGTSEISTACFSTTLGVSPERGFEREFDEFHHLGADGNAHRPDITERLNERLLPWIAEHADDGFLAVVWAMGTHHPYVTPSDVDDPTRPIEADDDVEGSIGWLKRQPRENVDAVRAAYDRAVRYSDGAFGELIDVLQAEGVYDETTVIVTADHGELFDEHARLEDAPGTVRRAMTRILGRRRCRELALFEPSAWLGHQTVFPYDELIHVPLVLKPGDGTVPVSTCEELVELVDLFPTVREELDAPTPSTVQGQSLYEVLSGNGTAEYAFSRSQVHLGNLVYSSVHTPGSKLCVREWSRPDFDRMRPSLVAKLTALHLLGPADVVVDETDGDGEELTDAEQRSVLEDRLDEHRERCAHLREEQTGSPDHVDVDDQTQEHLANLGYR